MATPIPGEDWPGRRRQQRRQALGDDLCRFRELIAALAGAFLIAHRLRRPEAHELAGMLDCYRRRGPRLAAVPAG